MRSSVDRFHKIQKRLNNLGVDFERFDAVDGRELSVDEVASYYSADLCKERHHKSLTAGEIGCYLSHRKIWQKMVADGLDRVIVLEDDAYCQDDFLDAIKVIDDLSNWDAIKLQDYRRNKFYRSIQLTEKFILGTYKRVPQSNAAYAISLNCAKKLLERKRFFRPVDVEFVFFGDLDLTVYGLKPYPVITNEEFESDISLVNAGEHSNRSSFIRNMKYRIKIFTQRLHESGKLNQVIYRQKS